jgi:hypothetical protein
VGLDVAVYVAQTLVEAVIAPLILRLLLGGLEERLREAGQGKPKTRGDICRPASSRKLMAMGTRVRRVEAVLHFSESTLHNGRLDQRCLFGFLQTRLCSIGNNVNSQAKLYTDKQPPA